MACWCAPAACHGHVLARLVNDPENMTVSKKSDDTSGDFFELREGGEESFGEMSEDGSIGRVIQDGPDFVCRLSVADVFVPFIVGKEGGTIKRIRSDTGTSVTILNRRQSSSKTQTVEVSGPSRENVEAACGRMHIVMADCASSLPYSHFLSIPLNSPDAQKEVRLM